MMWYEITRKSSFARKNVCKFILTVNYLYSVLLFREFPPQERAAGIHGLLDLPVVVLIIVWQRKHCLKTRMNHCWQWNCGYLDITIQCDLVFRESIKWSHDDVVLWQHFPRYWPFVRRIHRSPVNSPHKGQWRGALTFSLMCGWTNGWVNTRDAGDMRHYRAFYDVTLGQ